MVGAGLACPIIHDTDAGMNHDPLLSRYGPNTLAVERLLSRVRMLGSTELGRTVARWREVVGPEWHAAERAVGQAIADRDRHIEQSRVLERLHDVVARRWFGGRPPADERRPPASAHYVVATALLALLVRDLLPEGQFSLLYAPIAEVVPAHELDDLAWEAALVGWGGAGNDLSSVPLSNGRLANGRLANGRLTPDGGRDVGPRTP